jgi:hypothetical protein
LAARSVFRFSRHCLPCSFTPSTFYPVFLPPLVRVFPVSVWIVSAPPAVGTVSAASEPPWIAVGIVAVWLPLGMAAGIVAARLPSGIAVFPAIFVGPLETAVATAFGVSTLGHPRFAVSPNACSFSSRSSSVQLVDVGSDGSSMGVLPNDAPCSRSSNSTAPFHKRMGPFGRSPSLSHSAVTDTSALPTDATTNHRRNRCPHPSRGQRRHTSQGSPPPREARRIR